MVFLFYCLVFKISCAVAFDFGRVYDIFITQEQSQIFYKDFLNYTKYRLTKKDIEELKIQEDRDYNHLKYTRTRVLAPTL